MLFVALQLVAAAPATPACVNVDVGGALRTDFDCLNARFKGDVEAAQKGLPQFKGLDARSGDVALGVYNETAKRQQMGGNFGKSVVPLRPPPPVYPPGLPSK